MHRGARELHLARAPSDDPQKIPVNAAPSITAVRHRSEDASNCGVERWRIRFLRHGHEHAD